MYYKERKMEADNRYFIYRVGQLPMVKAAYDSAAAAYIATKNYNRLLSATLQMAENSVKYASEAERVQKVLHSPLVNAANSIAVTQLDKLEEKYPTIKKTPNELWDVGKDYYEHSRVKGGVEKIYAAKEFGVAKADDTKKYCQSVITGDVPIAQVICDLSLCSMQVLNGLLDYSDAFIDKYVAVEGTSQSGIADASCAERVHLMSNKAYNGLKYRTAAKYGETKEYVLKTLGDLHTAMILVEYAKNMTAWANEKTSSTFAMAQEQTRELWGEIQSRAETLGKRSEVVLLHLVQGLAVSVSSLSDQIVKYSSPYLPEGVEKQLTAAAGYAHEMRDSFSKANTLGDLRDEVIGEAKAKIVVMQDGLVNAIDYFVDFPPMCWLALDLNGVEINEELINMDRDTRRPGDTRFALPIIEPRQEDHAHSG